MRHTVSNHPLPKSHEWPACWEWPIPPASMNDNERWSEFHQGRCAICDLPDPKRVRDHDHTTGIIRGMLCNGCNIHRADHLNPLGTRYRHASPNVILGIHNLYNGGGVDLQMDHVGPTTLAEAVAALGSVGEVPSPTHAINDRGRYAADDRDCARFMAAVVKGVAA